MYLPYHNRLSHQPKAKRPISVRQANHYYCLKLAPFFDFLFTCCAVSHCRSRSRSHSRSHSHSRIGRLNEFLMNFYSTQITFTRHLFFVLSLSLSHVTLVTFLSGHLWLFLKQVLQIAKCGCVFANPLIFPRCFCMKTLRTRKWILLRNLKIIKCVCMHIKCRISAKLISLFN